MRNERPSSPLEDEPHLLYSLMTLPFQTIWKIAGAIVSKRPMEIENNQRVQNGTAFPLLGPTMKLYRACISFRRHALIESAGAKTQAEMQRWRGGDDVGSRGSLEASRPIASGRCSSAYLAESGDNQKGGSCGKRHRDRRPKNHLALVLPM